MTTPIPSNYDIKTSSDKYREDGFESESTLSSSDLSTAQNTLDSLPNNDVMQSTVKIEKPTQNSVESLKTVSASNKYWKAFVVLCGFLLMLYGQFNIPKHDVTELKDNVLDFFLPINNWIHSNPRGVGPRILLFCCATNIDAIFFITIYYWFRYSKTGRLPIAIALFYFIRTFVQMMFYQPFPKGYYWDSPGFPSFVAPYGETTDFFFSGHSGFLVLMQAEWGRNGYKKVQRYIRVSLLYTIFVLLVCQAHYSIDIFTGVFFADYVFGKVDTYKDIVDGFFKTITDNIENIFGKVFKRKMEKKEE